MAPAIKLEDQIRIEESFKLDIEMGRMTQEFCHYLATHPRAYLEFKEAMEDIRRMERGF